MVTFTRLIRRWLLREHEDQHTLIDARIGDADRELDEVEVRVRRLEAEASLHRRRGERPR